MSAAHALQSNQVAGVSLGGIAVIAVVGLVIAFLVTRIVLRVVVLVVVAALAVGVYHQRSTVLHDLDQHVKNCDASFLGIHVQASNAAVRKACADLAKQGGQSGQHGS
jgi:hypothetical protein